MLAPAVIRVKVDGVQARIRQAREVYGREAARCADLLLLLQAECPHDKVAQGPGATTKCMICDLAMDDYNRN